MDHELKGVRPTDKPKKTWSEITEKDRISRKLIKDVVK